MIRAALAASFGIAVALVGSSARAEGPFVERHVTLPAHDWSFDFGLGVAHAGNPDLTAPGLNVEAAVAPIDRLEIGLRTGFRVDDDGRILRSDQYGRLFDRQTFGTGNDTFANPELRVRGAVVRGDVVEVGLEGRVYLPLETGTHAGVMMGLPLLFHLGNHVRLDTGAYVPVIFSSPNLETHFSAPIDLWFQPSPRVWLGPMSGFVYNSIPNTVDLSLGFGFGYQILRTLDLKTMLLFPDLNHDQARDFGLGVGIQVRIE